MPYPTLPIAYGVTERFTTDRKLERASNGTLRGRVFYTTKKRTFKIQHPALTPAQLATFDAFYDSNLSSTFTFTYTNDGIVFTDYTVAFSADPVRTPLDGGRVNVDLELTEV